MPAIAVTGASGVLGRSITAELLARGHAVRALTRRRTAPDAPGLTWIEGGLDDRAALDALVAGTDAIVHAAYCPLDETVPGRSIVEHFAQTNLAGAVRLLERTPLTKLRQLVFVSSLAVYGETAHLEPAAQRVPIDEDYPVWPREMYGAHKAALERLLLGGSGALGLNVSSFRIGCVLADYGGAPRDHLGRLVGEALRTGAVTTRVGVYTIAARDAAAVLAGAIGDVTVHGVVLNTFDRWLDLTAETAARLSRILGREIRAGAAPAPEPQPGIRNDRLRARRVAWHTDAELDALLRELVARQRT